METTDLLDLSTTIQELTNDTRLQMNLSGAIAKKAQAPTLAECRSLRGQTGQGLRQQPQLEQGQPHR